jgi:excisionase family DNA binding protein
MNHLTTAQLAEALGVSPRRVLALARSRGVASIRVGRAHLWPRSAQTAMRERTNGRPRLK